MEKLRPQADGKTPIVLYKEISRLTLDIISSVKNIKNFDFSNFFYFNKIEQEFF